MKIQSIPFLLVMLALPVMPSVAKADAAADKQAELLLRKQEAEKKAAEKKKAAADKKAAESKAASEKAAIDAKAAADKKAADDKAATDKKATDDKAAVDKKAADDKAAVDKKAADDKAAVDKKAADGKAAGAKDGGTDTKVVVKAEEKDAPLPASDIETLRKDRTDRRRATVERLRRRWGSVLADANGTADLKTHSRRVAFLQRVRAVADEKKDKKAVELADELLTKEDERHSKAMNSLREGALTAGSPK